MGVLCTSFPINAFASRTFSITWLNGKYDYVSGFSEGLAIVKNLNLYGFIDATGKEVIPVIYEDADLFKDGLARVKKDGRYGYIDKTGKEVIPIIYYNIGSFSEGLAWIKMGDKYNPDKYGYIDKTGKEVIPPIYSYASDFEDGVAIVRKDSFYGLIDKKGNEISLFYNEIYPFSEGIARVVEYRGFERRKIFGYIDNKGNEIVPPIYDMAEDFKEGFARVYAYDEKGNGFYGFIDKTGKEVIPLIYNEAGDFNEGLARVGKHLYRSQYAYGFVDKTGKEVIPLTYQQVGDFKEGVAWVSNGNKRGLIDKTGNIILPLEYRQIREFSEGLAAVEEGGNFGFIDNKGNIVIPLIYDYAYDFNDGVVVVSKEGKYGLIDKTGKEIAPIVYDNIRTYKGIFSFYDGLACVEKDGKVGFIDETGKEVVPMIYDDAGDFNDGVALVVSGDMLGIICDTAKLPKDQIRKEAVATPTSSKVMVNGMEKSFNAYNIDGYNYFKLRDLAAVLRTTEKKFEVTWDNEKKAINLISNKPYTMVGGELSKGDGKVKTAIPNTNVIYKDGKEINLTAYAIDGNNYFKLRDIAQVFNFGVTWDGKTQTIGIDTSVGYAAE